MTADRGESGDRAEVISGRTARWLVAIGSCAFVAVLFLSVFSDALPPARSVQANAYSQSAIGHHAFVETLKRMDVPVTVSRYNSAERAGARGPLMLIEPQPARLDPVFVDGLSAADIVVVVLPKWIGEPDPVRPGWISGVATYAMATPERVLQEFDPDATVTRLPRAVGWTRNETGIEPTIDTPQLIRSTLLVPIIAAGAGILVGELWDGNRTILLISDPDILNTHGLGRGRNAARC